MITDEFKGIGHIKISKCELKVLPIAEGKVIYIIVVVEFIEFIVVLVVEYNFHK